MLLIVRTEKEGNKSKRDLILNLFYSGFYLPLACWVSQSRGSDCLCRTKNFISMLLLMLTHFIILEHLSIKFIETLKSLNSTQSSKGIREPIIFFAKYSPIRIAYESYDTTLILSVSRKRWNRHHPIVCHVKISHTLWTEGWASNMIAQHFVLWTVFETTTFVVMKNSRSREFYIIRSGNQNISNHLNEFYWSSRH